MDRSSRTGRPRPCWATPSASTWWSWPPRPGPAAAILPWLAPRGLREPATVLGDWHVPLSAEALADFARAFPHLRYEVRSPTLDDLFLKLALEP